MGNADDEAERRQHERASTVEDVLGEVREDLGEQAYPTTSEALSATYGDTVVELPNETESLGSAFDRLDVEFADADEAYEALVREFERGGVVDRADAAERATWSEERVDDERPPADEGSESGREQSMERARQAQQADASDAEETNDE
jgi:hypothetical protein